MRLGAGSGLSCCGNIGCVRCDLISINRSKIVNLSLIWTSSFRYSNNWESNSCNFSCIAIWERNVCNSLIRSDSSSISSGMLIDGGIASAIGGSSINSFSVSSSSRAEIISLFLRLLIPSARSKPTANNTNNKIIPNCTASGCSCNICGAHLPSTRLVPRGHCLSVMNSSGFWN